VINQKYTGTPTSRRQANCPTTVKAGDFVLIGKAPAVALDDYNSNVGGTTFLLNGTFIGTVIARTSASPLTNAAVNPGDLLYATGTLDTATNVTTGLTIDKNSSNTAFGSLDPTDPAITSGTTSTTAGIRI
jgi:predicted RecA/RadA family phage recombinase